jgi:two-component system, NtrC family, sensor histidine kinase HydH
MDSNPRQSDDAQEQARRADQLAFADTLAGGLIHEIKNPLTSLSMNLQLLEEDWRNPKTPEERRALKRIQTLLAETNRLKTILDEFVNFIREHRLRLTVCDVNRLVESMVAFVTPQMEARGIQLRTSLGLLPMTRVDENRIKQVLLNLLLNAAQAMKETGPREIILITAAEDQKIRIDVTDTGRGIPKGDLEKVFQAFYTKSKGGLGLGLPTARRIVEEHGGRLTVESEPGRGSRFSVLLPIRSAEAAPKVAANAGRE